MASGQISGLCPCPQKQHSEGRGASRCLIQNYRKEGRKEDFRPLAGIPSRRSYFPLCFHSQEIRPQIQVNPSFSSLSPHLVLFSRRRVSSWVPEKKQLLKYAHPSRLWDSKYFGARHRSVNDLPVAPTWMQVGAKPSWLSVTGRESRKQATGSPEGANISPDSHTLLVTIPYPTPVLCPQPPP